MSLTARPARRQLRLPRLAAPLLTGSLVGAATVAVAIRDPHVAGSWGTCPWLAVTGTFCPGCGGLRAVHDLAHLDVVGALSNNAFVVLAAAVAAVAWVVWLRSALLRRPVDWSRWVTPRVAYWVVGGLLVFSAVRNLPFAAWFAPDLIG